MNKLILTIVFFTFCTFGFSRCKQQAFTPESTFSNIDTAFLDKSITEKQAIAFGDALLKSQVTISKYDGEIYAHDSKLLIVDGIAYCAYYGNDTNTQEGTAGQSIRLAVFDVENPKSRIVYDVFKENGKFVNLKLDPNTPSYTPVLFLTKEGNVRVLAKVYTSSQPKYYYRDFNPVNKIFTEPQICKITPQGGIELVDFEIKNVRNYLKTIFGNNYDLNTEYMYATSEPVFRNGYFYLGLTVGRFTVNWRTDEGTTLLMRTNNAGQTFEMIGATDSRKINSKYCKQFVEGAFDWINEDSKDMLLIGRNSLGEIMSNRSNDDGNTFSIPFSVNEVCGFNTLASKPILKKHNDGFISFWNTKENVGNYNVRTTLEIRYGKDLLICGNKVKIKIRNEFGCHYPSIYRYKNNFYLTYTTDSRRLNRNSTGEIVFVKLPF
ncbi:hypothetical protein [Runella slithyformis]|uniref:Uncharacterized protein n=1 Tax=Runella slithyformis (strain ATCC 29530 / DSM 19594 / LMG 11500 / NCIMB 11436 / LSU 4) TaxID=761193 RepID=A0A7U3ZPK6_RUNSL|nr:hypothetical protein [Runella slithyformis]AEI51017.1 hypothetical protein Runsl_4698 [Runella slithyformis DSM 19594]